jgi:predicted dehydrogenase
MNKYKIGIIGCGFCANGAGPHQKHMPALIQMPEEVEMVAFCDIIKEKAAKAAKQYGVNNAKVYTDYRELLKDGSIDIVHVCTPNKSHAEIAVAALEAGKHVMCEKPMAKTYADAQKILEAAKRTNKMLTIGYQNRFRPDSLYLAKVCQRGELGEIYYAHAEALRRRAVPTWGVFLNAEEQGGGALIDIGTHALDLTLWMMNNYEPVSVTGSVFKKFAGQKETGNFFGDWDKKQFTVEDSAFGFIKMKNGATIFLEAAWAINKLDCVEAKTTLCGTKAGADMVEGVRINKSDLGKLVTIKPAVLPSVSGVFDAPDSPPAGLAEARAWINSIRTNTAPVVTPEQAIVVTRILEAIYESSRIGKTVEF